MGDNQSDNSSSNFKPIRTGSRSPNGASTPTKVSCMRMDRHFSALVYACHKNQLDCLRMLF